METLKSMKRRHALQDRVNAALTDLYGQPVVIGSVDRLSFLDAEYLASVLEALVARGKS